MSVLPDAENRTIVSSFIWTKHRNVMEGQTDGRRPLASTVAQYTCNARCKNWCSLEVDLWYTYKYRKALTAIHLRVQCTPLVWNSVVM